MNRATNQHQLKITAGHGLDVGVLRAGKPNQDNLGMPPPWAQGYFATKGQLYIVADGMGGASGGQQASQIAVNTTFQTYYQDPDADIGRSLQRAIQTANAEIHRLGNSNPDLQGMGTTIVAAVVRGNELVVAHAGDSRAYLLRGGALQQLTKDHSWVQEQIDNGLLTPEQAARHEQRNVITRNLGNEPQVRADVNAFVLQEGDVLLLCSDGLWGPVSEEEIANVLRQQAGDLAAQSLIALANEHGGPDNISAVILHLGEHVPAMVPAAATTPQKKSRLSMAVIASAMLGTVAAVALVVFIFGRGGSKNTTATSGTVTPMVPVVARTSGTPSPTAQGTTTATTILPVPAAGGNQPGALPPTSTAKPTSVPVTPTPRPVPTKAKATPAQGTATQYDDAPVLLSPEDGKSFNSKQQIDFKWSWDDGTPKEDEYFDVRIWQGNNRLYDKGANTNETSWVMSNDNLGPGTYFWAVAVIRKDKNGKVTTLSPESTPRTFTISGGNSGGRGGSNGGATGP